MKKHGHVAIMQPYIFPYLGYFHLIEASELFIFYDDVSYIKKGWINRNRILLQQEPSLFTLPIQQASQNVLIKDTLTCIDTRWKKKFYAKLTHSYQKAPHFTQVMELIDASLKHTQNGSIASVAINAIQLIYQYLNHDITYKRSSDISPHTQGMDKAERLIKITKDLGYTSYLNAPSGKELYSKGDFKNQGIDLHFIRSLACHYSQFHHDFIPSLSIIDVLMFNTIDETKTLFQHFTVE